MNETLGTIVGALSDGERAINQSLGRIIEFSELNEIIRDGISILIPWNECSSLSVVFPSSINLKEKILSILRRKNRIDRSENYFLFHLLRKYISWYIVSYL